MPNTIDRADLAVIITTLQYRIDHLYRVSESHRRHYDYRAQWDTLQERRRVQDVLDKVLAQ